MRRYTTPTITLDIIGVDLSEGWHTITYLRQGEDVLKVEDAPCETTENGSKITIELTQEQTGMFDTTRQVNAQVRYINAAGYAGATNIAGLSVEPVIVNEVIAYDSV